MSQHKYRLRGDPKQTFAGDEWEVVQTKKAAKNTKKQQQSDTSKARNETDMDTGDNIPKFKFPCNGCDIVVQNNEALLYHQATCLKLQVDPSKKNSFQCQARNLFPAEVNQPTPTREKVIVLSQTTGQVQTEASSPTYAAIVSDRMTYAPKVLID